MHNHGRNYYLFCTHKKTTLYKIVSKVIKELVLPRRDIGKCDTRLMLKDRAAGTAILWCDTGFFEWNGDIQHAHLLGALEGVRATLLKEESPY